MADPDDFQRKPETVTLDAESSEDSMAASPELAVGLEALARAREAKKAAVDVLTQQLEAFARLIDDSVDSVPVVVDENDSLVHHIEAAQASVK